MVLSTKTEVDRLADQLERSFHGGAWHGPGTGEVLSGIDAATAGKSTGSGNTIVALVRHMTFWLDAARVRIAGGGDVDADADWAEEGPISAETWARVVTDIEEAHARLHAAVLDLSDDRLDEPVPGSDPSVRGLLLGIVQHNAYHTGQIVQIAKA